MPNYFRAYGINFKSNICIDNLTHNYFSHPVDFTVNISRESIYGFENKKKIPIYRYLILR